MRHYYFFITLFFLAAGAAQAQNDLLAEVTYLKHNLQNPDDYLVSKFRKYPYVLLGEDHAVKENLQFVQAIIPKLYQAGVYNLCMEFGAFEKQQQLDSLLNAPAYDERLARDMMFFYNVGWAYREYYDLYKAVWAFNRSLKPGAKRFRIVNLSYRYNWRHFRGGPRTPENMKAVFYRGTPDKFRTAVIQREVIEKNEKALIYMGHVHVVTHYQIPSLEMNNDDFCGRDTGMVGNRLFKQYPGKIFAVMFHTPMYSKTRYKPLYVATANGEMENVLQKIGYPPAGFDLKGTPMGKLKDDSFFSLCHPGFMMQDFFDGYIFLKPFRELTGCTYDEDFFTGKSWAEIRDNFPDPDWKNAASLNDYKQLVRDYTGLPERYRDVIQTAIPRVQYGRIVRINNFPSKFVAPRSIDIWLPDRLRPKTKYSVLYMHDGQMLFDAAITWNGTEWKVDENLQQLRADRSLKDCIVVGIWNTGAARHAEYFPEKPFQSLPDSLQQRLLGTSLAGGPLADNYLKFITQELKPYIDGHYPTRSDRANTFIAGSSMGGLIALYALCEYPEVFGGAACLSTHWVGDTAVKGDLIPGVFIQYVDKHLPDQLTHKLYFDRGTAGLDSLYAPHQLRVDRVLQQKGYRTASLHTQIFHGADHSEKAWSKRLQLPLEFLLHK